MDEAHLNKVHIDTVKLQPLAFVEKGDFGLRRTLAPEKETWTLTLRKYFGKRAGDGRPFVLVWVQ